MRRILLAMAAFLAVACNAEPQDPGNALDLSPGLVWAEAISTSTSRTTGTLSIAGEFKADTSLSPVPKREGVCVHKVIRRVHSEVFDKKGVLVQTISSRADDASPEVLDELDVTPILTERILVENEGWLREFPTQADDFSIWFGLDGNSTRGRALYPIDPQTGKYYTDDQGSTHRAVGRETLPAGSAERMEVQLPAPLIPWETFYDQCFYKNDEGRPLHLKSECREYLYEQDGELPRARITTWVHGPMLYGSEIAVERLTVDAICCASMCVDLYSSGNMSGPYDLTCQKDGIHFEATLERSALATTVTRIARHEDPLTPPTLEDAEVQP